jgi:hypothetical protein
MSGSGMTQNQGHGSGGAVPPPVLPPVPRPACAPGTPVPAAGVDRRVVVNRATTTRCWEATAAIR